MCQREKERETDIDREREGEGERAGGGGGGGGGGGRYGLLETCEVCRISQTDRHDDVLVVVVVVGEDCPQGDPDGKKTTKGQEGQK